MFSLLASLLLAYPLYASAQSCSCYSTNNDGTYSNTAFFDFRSREVGTIEEPLSTFQGPSYSDKASGAYLNSDEFTSFWAPQFWATESAGSEDAPVSSQRDPRNVFLDTADDGTTALVLRNKRFDSFWSGGELLWNKDPFLHGSFRFRGRVVGDEGSCAGFFTYLDDSNESDIEFLTSHNVNYVHYTNQPGYSEGGTVVWDMSTSSVTPAELKKRSYPPLLASRQSGGGFDTWKTYRLDWHADSTSYYIDGTQVNAKLTANVPQVPVNFMLNNWSNGADGWSGDAAVGSTSRFEIQWIEMFYGDGQCDSPCAVDESDSAVTDGFGSA